MTYQHKESSEPELSSNDFARGKPTNTSGPFPKFSALRAPAKKRCTPAVAGVLASFYASYVKNLAVLGELELKEVKDQARIDRLKANNEHLRETAQTYTSDVSLSDWKRRLPADAKRAFSFLGFALMPDAQAFTFRLGHEVANAALSAKKGPTDHLSALIRSLGVTDLAFISEFVSGNSEENHGFHVHGIARIPVTISNQIIRQLLAPKQNLKLDPPIKGYRQRGENKAIKVTELQTPGAWGSYSAKEFDFTAHCLQSNPDYASRSATQAGREIYEAIRVWVRS